MNQHDELLAAMAAAGMVVPGMEAPLAPVEDDEIVVDQVVDERLVADEQALEAETASIGAAGPTDAVSLIEAAAEDGTELTETDVETIAGIDAAAESEVPADTLIEAPVEPVAEPLVVATEAHEEIADHDLEAVVGELERREEIYGAPVTTSLADDLAEALRQPLTPFTVTLPPPVTSAPKAAEAPKPKAGTGAGRREARFAPGGAGGFVAKLMGDPEVQAQVDALPKKVKEKAANLAAHINGGAVLSVFTQAAVSIMQAEGAISNERLVKAFTTEATKRGVAEGYSIGTARSQAGQQISLFRGLNIGIVREKGIVPNPESPIWQALSGQHA